MAIEIVDVPSYKVVDLSIVFCQRLPGRLSSGGVIIPEKKNTMSYCK